MSTNPYLSSEAVAAQQSQSQYPSQPQGQSQYPGQPPSQYPGQPQSQPQYYPQQQVPQYQQQVPQYQQQVPQYQPQVPQYQPQVPQYQQQVPQYQQQYQQQYQPQVQQDPFNYFFQKYQISSYYRNDLMTLSKFDIILILDDSGSMSTPSGQGKTRWTELKDMVNPIIELGALLDVDGIDVLFLNRGRRNNVRSILDIQDLLVQGPQGRTPLSMRVREAMKSYNSKPQLIIIMTDGEPYTVDYRTDPNYDSVSTFANVIAHERNPDLTFMSVLKCSSNDDETGYLDKMDRELTNFDVIDDFISERNEVWRKQGSMFQYTPGDNIARLLLGAIYPRYDKMDEKFIE
jgi:hypothetical protein